MESEAVSSLKIAVLLGVTGSLIFMVLMLVDLVKPSFYDRVLEVVNVAESEKDKQFEDYDRRMLSGTKLMKLFKMYEGTGFGIVYDTVASRASASSYAVNIGGIFQGAAQASISQHGITITEYHINSFSTWKTKANARDDFYTKTLLSDAAGNILRCENIVSTRYSGKADPVKDEQYVSPDANFYSELIKDRSGEIIGVCLTQK